MSEQREVALEGGPLLALRNLKIEYIDGELWIEANDGEPPLDNSTVQLSNSFIGNYMVAVDEFVLAFGTREHLEGLKAHVKVVVGVIPDLFRVTDVPPTEIEEELQA